MVGVVHQCCSLLREHDSIVYHMPIVNVWFVVMRFLGSFLFLLLLGYCGLLCVCVGEGGSGFLSFLSWLVCYTHVGEGITACNRGSFLLEMYMFAHMYIYM